MMERMDIREKRYPVRAGRGKKPMEEGSPLRSEEGRAFGCWRLEAKGGKATIKKSEIRCLMSEVGGQRAWG
jgi:hypothetical protein